MGDRCYCNLTLIGILSHEHVSHLAQVLVDAGVDEYGSNAKKVEDALLNGENSFSFYDVNYAQMDSTLQSACTDLKLSYIWHNDSGDDYGEADTYHDARSDEEIEYNLSNSCICLTLEEINREGAVEEARLWEKFSKDVKFFVYKSNHELIAAQAAETLPEGYIELIADIEIAA